MAFARTYAWYSEMYSTPSSAFMPLLRPCKTQNLRWVYDGFFNVQPTRSPPHSCLTVSLSLQGHARKPLCILPSRDPVPTSLLPWAHDPLSRIAYCMYTCVLQRFTSPAPCPSHLPP